MKKSAITKEAVFCVIMLYAGGCAAYKYMQTEDRFCGSAVSKAEAMTAAEQVLAGMQFEIEKLDTEAGYIRTQPLAGAQTFEFWRGDNVGSFNRAEADLHSIRRTVELTVSEQAGQLCVNCNATTQRLSVAGEQTAERSYRAMSGQTSIQKISHEQKGNMTWLDLGRDSQLETEILKRIESRLTADKKQLAAAKPATGG
jgi:hypothetical protein